MTSLSAVPDCTLAVMKQVERRRTTGCFFKACGKSMPSKNRWSSRLYHCSVLRSRALHSTIAMAYLTAAEVFVSANDQLIQDCCCILSSFEKGNTIWLLIDLHWLLIQQMIYCLLWLHSTVSAYVAEMSFKCNVNDEHIWLQICCHLVVPMVTKKEIVGRGQCSFTYSGKFLWNAVLQDFKEISL